jgi:hypothetical protein
MPNTVPKTGGKGFRFNILQIFSEKSGRLVKGQALGFKKSSKFNSGQKFVVLSKTIFKIEIEQYAPTDTV